MAIKISGFTVVRNAILMGYPVVESIRSALPVVDEFVIGVGQSDDNTRELIAKIEDPKIRIIDTFWDLQQTSKGLMLSQKTNEVLRHCQNDWCLYLQADEVLHQQDYVGLLQAIQRADRNPSIQGLLFRYLHFYGSFGVLATNRKWYRHEVRMVRKSTGIQSIGDAQSFAVNGSKPSVLPANARIFHYGWVKAPPQMGAKARLLDYWWHGSKPEKDRDFQFKRQYGLREFKGTHPAVMQQLVASQNWTFDWRRSWRDWNWKDLNLWMSDLLERCLKHRIGEYKAYRLIKESL